MDRFLPCKRWLRALVNRIDPILFGRCFESWVAALWPGRHELIAIDGKTSRRTHDNRKGLKALHTLSLSSILANLSGVGECVLHASPDMAGNFYTVSAWP
jgi:hypothetical protein